MFDDIPLLPIQACCQLQRRKFQPLIRGNMQQGQCGSRILQVIFEFFVRCTCESARVHPTVAQLLRTRHHATSGIFAADLRTSRCVLSAGGSGS